MTLSDQWLATFADECRQSVAAIRRIDRKKVDIDIAARKAEVAWIKGYIRRRPRLIKELDARGVSEEDWCAGLGKGHSISQVRRAIQLARPGALQRYVRRRRVLGDNGRFGLAYAIELAQQEGGEGEQARIQSGGVNALAKRRMPRSPARVRPSLLLVLPS